MTSFLEIITDDILENIISYCTTIRWNMLNFFITSKYFIQKLYIIKNFTVSGSTNVYAIVKLTNVEKIWFHPHTQPFSQFDNIHNFKHLKKISFLSITHKDILLYTPFLKELWCYGKGWTGEEFKYCFNLEHLRIVENPNEFTSKKVSLEEYIRPKNYFSFEYLTNLTHLRISARIASGCYDMHELVNLKKLYFYDAIVPRSEAGDVPDIELHNLEHLKLPKGARTLGFLLSLKEGYLSNLKVLRLGSCGITDNHILALTKLEILCCDLNFNIHLTRIKAQLPNLRYIEKVPYIHKKKDGKFHKRYMSIKDIQNVCKDYGFPEDIQLKIKKVVKHHIEKSIANNDYVTIDGQRYMFSHKQ